MNVPANQMNPAVPAAADLTDSELRALAYFAVGVSSEGSNAGRDVSNRLSFAGRIQNGIMTPVGNSGFSIGTLQIDLGQRPAVATALVDAYQAWAARTQPDWVLGRLDMRRQSGISHEMDGPLPLTMVGPWMPW
jgi:hypothetical protein